MQLERKLATLALIVTAVAASLAFAQVGPARKGESKVPASQAGAFDTLQKTPMQDCLTDLIIWKQSNTLHLMGGQPLYDYNSISEEVAAARMEVVRACNLYLRATFTTPQQAEYDRTILDPKGHPLPPKWENMRLKGTLVTALLKADAAQQKQAQKVLDTFRERNHAIWGTGHKNGGYVKNHELLLKEFRAILNKQQLAEFNNLWSSYVKDVSAAQQSVAR